MTFFSPRVVKLGIGILQPFTRNQQCKTALEKLNLGMTPPARPKRQRKFRTKTFTGCWTCRSRHLKCDEGQPSCTRCLNANLECEGYGLRLSWTQVRGPSNPNRQRRQIRRPTTLESQRNLTEGEVGQETATPPHQSPQPAPVQSSQHLIPSILAGVAATSPSQLHPIETTPSISQTDELDDSVYAPQIFLLESLHGLNQTIAEQFSISPVQQGFVERGSPRYQINEQQPTNGSILFELDLAPLESGEIYPESDSSQNLEVLPDKALQRQLLEHWTLSLAETMMPIPSFDNPVLNIITPIALEGAEAVSGTASPATSVFHLICSASAFHLARVQKSARFLDNCLEHHELGIKHLRQTVSVEDDSKSVALLAAFCMCLINETLSIGAPYWRVHVRGACNWLNQTDNAVWTATSSASALYQLFTGIVMMIQLQLGSELEKPLKHPVTFSKDDDKFCMDRIFGCSFSTFSILLQMIESRQNIIGLTPDQLDLMEMKLYLSVPPPVDYTVDAEVQSIIFHHKRVFHYATIVYLRRSFRGSPLLDVQPWVSKAVQHLEHIIQVTNKPCSPCVWPVAVVAFEAFEGSLQRRIERLLNHLSNVLSFDIWLNLKEFTHSLWEERRKAGMTDLSWETYFDQKHGGPLLLA